MRNFFITLDIQNFFFWKCDIIYFYLDLNNKTVLLYWLWWSEWLCFAFLLWFSCIYILKASSATGLYLKIKFSEKQLELCEGLGRGLLLHQGKVVGVSSNQEPDHWYLNAGLLSLQECKNKSIWLIAPSWWYFVMEVWKKSTRMQYYLAFHQHKTNFTYQK